MSETNSEPDGLRGKPLLDHGHIELLDVMGTDQTIVDAARVSYQDGTKKKSSTRDLIRYMMRHRHDSPFEMPVLRFRVKCPIFVARQWMRHRTFSFNEVSGRYSILPDEFYAPDPWMGQSEKNKQGSQDELGYSSSAFKHLLGDNPPMSAEQVAYKEYHRRLNFGISREQARSCLPVSTYTEFWAQANLRNLLHFSSLRLDLHAQMEIRVYAEFIAECVREHFPLTWEAFEDYRLHAVTFSKQELGILNYTIRNNKMTDEQLHGTDLSERERMEFLGKVEKIRHA